MLSHGLNWPFCSCFTFSNWKLNWWASVEWKKKEQIELCMSISAIEIESDIHTQVHSSQHGNNCFNNTPSDAVAFECGLKKGKGYETHKSWK